MVKMSTDKISFQILKIHNQIINNNHHNHHNMIVNIIRILGINIIHKEIIKVLIICIPKQLNLTQMNLFIIQTVLKLLKDLISWKNVEKIV